MEASFQIDEHRFAVYFLLHNDSRYVQEMGKYRKLVVFNSDLQVTYFDPSSNGPKIAGKMSVRNTHWVFNPIDSKDSMVLKPHQNFDWRSLLDSEIEVAKYLISKFRLSGIPESKLIKEDQDQIASEERTFPSVWEENASI